MTAEHDALRRLAISVSTLKETTSRLQESTQGLGIAIRAMTSALRRGERRENEVKEPNVPLLRKTLEHIVAFPEEWDQTVYAAAPLEQLPELTKENTQACGTAFCFAGHALLLSGKKFNWMRPVRFGLGDRPGWVTVNFTTDGEAIERAAEKELGLSYRQAEQLFDVDNSLGRIVELLVDFTGEDLFDIVDDKRIAAIDSSHVPPTVRVNEDD